MLDLLVVELQDNPELLNKIKPLVDEACQMGIKLVKKLVDYKVSLPEWEKTENPEEVKRIRELRQQCQVKLLQYATKKDSEH